MSYIQKDLLDGERIVYTGKLHWFIFAHAISFLFIGACLFFVAHKNGMQVMVLLSLLFLVAALFSFFKALFKKLTTELAVTNKRVIFKKGFISRDTMELNHTKIESIREEQGVLDRIFDCGTLVIEGTGGGKEYLRNIDAPMTFKKQAQSAADAANSKS